MLFRSSLNTILGEVSNSISPVDRRDIVNRNGDVAWRAKTRSEFSEEMICVLGMDPDWLLLSMNLRVGTGSRGMTCCGISHLWCLESVILTRNRSLVS